jgi:hypothetical protein
MPRSPQRAPDVCSNLKQPGDMYTLRPYATGASGLRTPAPSLPQADLTVQASARDDLVCTRPSALPHVSSNNHAAIPPHSLPPHLSPPSFLQPHPPRLSDHHGENGGHFPRTPGAASQFCLRIGARPALRLVIYAARSCCDGIAAEYRRLATQHLSRRELGRAKKDRTHTDHYPQGEAEGAAAASREW